MNTPLTPETTERLEALAIRLLRYALSQGVTPDGALHFIFDPEGHVPLAFVIAIGPQPFNDLELFVQTVTEVRAGRPAVVHGDA